MVIDVSNVSHIWAEVCNHRSKPSPGVVRINCVSGQLNFWQQTTCLLEISVGDEMAIIGRRIASHIGHGKQRYFMPLGPQQFHGFEQVDLGTAESVVILVAK